MILISDTQQSLFNLDQYECEELVKWGWLDDEQLGSNNDILLPNCSVREQNNNLLPNLEIVKVQGRSYFLTPTKPHKPLPKERNWYDIKTQKGKQYLYLRWRADKRQKSRCLGRLDALKYSESSS